MLFEAGWAVLAACLGTPQVPEQTRLFPVESASLLLTKLAEGHIHLVSETADDPAWRAWPRPSGLDRIRSAIIAPLIVDGELLGLFSVNSYVPRFYSMEQVRVAGVFGESATHALRNARLYAVEQARARAAEELAEIRRDFVASVSHELRTPLAAIVGFGELLQAHWESFDEAQRLDRIGKIVQAANRQKRLVEELLLLNRLEDAGLGQRREALRLSQLVLQAVTEVQATYPSQHVDLQGPDDLAVLADSLHGVQILVNMLDNAAKYSPEGSSIAVRWASLGAMAVLEVVDQGKGVPEDGRERLFTRFGRLPGSRIRAGRVGTGLGLYLSREMARAMSGDLELAHTGSEGSVFRLSLPLA